MANQSAWSTEYFDNRPLEYKGQAETAAAASPRTAVPVGNPPPIYTTGKSNSAAGRNTGSVSSFSVLVCMFLVPRVLQVIFLIIALSVTAAIPDLTAFSSLQFLLSMDVIALVYSLAVLVWVIICLVSGNSQFGGTGSLASYITFILDQVLAYTLLAACAAACAVIVLIDDGEIEAGTNCASLGIETACSKAKGAISMGIFAFALLAFSAAISSQRLRA
ncbi:unnamed protein product [Sphagnum jensenii]|uniref:CASP-like protein n=1 Tax=Sphagnum jensenii TaxID=128206 RepID=A0ABP1AH41_9BRYO